MCTVTVDDTEARLQVRPGGHGRLQQQRRRRQLQQPGPAPWRRRRPADLQQLLQGRPTPATPPGPTPSPPPTTRPARRSTPRAATRSPSPSTSGPPRRPSTAHPASVAINQGTLCIVTVDDTDGGHQVQPGRHGRLQPDRRRHRHLQRANLHPGPGSTPTAAPARSATGRPPAPAPTRSPAPTRAARSTPRAAGNDTVTVTERSDPAERRAAPRRSSINQASDVHRHRHRHRRRHQVGSGGHGQLRQLRRRGTFSNPTVHPGQ